MRASERDDEGVARGADVAAGAGSSKKFDRTTGRRRETLLGMRAFVLLAALVALGWPSICQAAWFEVIGAKTAAAAKLQTEGDLRNVTMCDGDAANLTVAVEGGTPPWKVAVMRNGELYTRVVVDQSWLQQFSSTPSGIAKLRLPLPGRYSLLRVCDQGGCNGTVSDKAIVVSKARHPTAKIEPQDRAVCMHDSSSALGSENYKIHLRGVPPFIVQYLRIGHQHEKRLWEGTDGLSTQYMSAGEHEIPAEIFSKKGLWTIAQVGDESGCPADMSAITVVSKLAVVPRPRVAIELLSTETCGGQDMLILVRLVQGNPPWSFTFRLPDGSLKEITGLMDRTYLHQTVLAGNYSVVKASDWACEALEDGLPSDVVQVSTRIRVQGRLYKEHIATCPGVFKEILGEVEGVGPWWLEIWRNGAFWRRIRHPREADEQDEIASSGGAVRDSRPRTDLDHQFSFAVEASGEYTLHSVTDSTQCSARGEGKVIVTEKAAPEVRLQQEHSCEGDELTLNLNVSGSCFVTLMASGWAAPREIDLGLNESVASPKDVSELQRIVRKQVALLPSGEATPGQYTIVRVRDAQCSTATSQTVTVYPRPEIVLRGSGTPVCDSEASQDWASLEVRARGSFMGQWAAIIRYPSGRNETVRGGGSESKIIRVPEKGTYALTTGFSLNPRCTALLFGNDDKTGTNQYQPSVTIKRFDTPRAVVSGGGTLCRQGGTGALVDLVVQVTGGTGPYRVLIARDGIRDTGGFKHVISSDGRLVIPVRIKGSYRIVEVHDVHKCANKEISNEVVISNFPTAVAAFKQQIIGICPGDKPQSVSIGVTSKDSPGPWQLAVLRNGRYHTNGQVAVNSSLQGGNFLFNVEEVVDGRTSSDGMLDEYQIDKDSFTDARGCLGDVKRGTLQVRVNRPPSVKVEAETRQGTCEGKAVHLRFTDGLPPWSVTVKMWGAEESSKDSRASAGDSNGTWAGKSSGSTCEISGITDRVFSLSALKDMARQDGVGFGHGKLRTTCPASKAGYLPPGYHVITSVRGGEDDMTTGSRMCRRDGIVVPLIIHHLPRAEMSRLVCKELCKDEVPSALVNLTQGQPPFTIRLKDQYENVVEQELNASAGEFRFDRARVVQGHVDPRALNFDRHNWTMVSLRDANSCETSLEGERHAAVGSASSPTVSVGGGDSASFAMARTSD